MNTEFLCRNWLVLYFGLELQCGIGVWTKVIDCAPWETEVENRMMGFLKLVGYRNASYPFHTTTLIYLEHYVTFDSMKHSDIIFQCNEERECIVTVQTDERIAYKFDFSTWQFSVVNIWKRFVLHVGDNPKRVLAMFVSQILKSIDSKKTPD